MKRRFEFSEGSSDKFWEVEVNETEVTTRWGRIGAAGQIKSKSHPSASAALADAHSQAAAKAKKGYRETPLSPSGTLSEGEPAPPAEPSPRNESSSLDPAGALEASDSQSALPPSPADSPPETDHQVLLAEKADPSRARNPWPHPMPSYEQGWSEIRKGFKDSEKWQGGPGQCVPYLRAPLSRVLMDLQNATPPRHWTPLEGAVLMHVVKLASVAYPKNGDRMMEGLIAGMGFAFCLEALLLARKLQIGYSKSCLWVTRDRNRGVWHQNRGHRDWISVRRHLTRATPVEYEQARSFALAWRAQGPLSERCLLSYAFPDEPWWSEDLDEVLANPNTTYGRNSYADGALALLACATDLPRARMLCLGGLYRPDAGMAWNLAFLHGGAAVPLLLELSSSSPDYLAPVVHLPSLSTALSLKTLLEDRKHRAFAVAFYEAHPRLGLQALAQVVQGGGKLAEIARPLLGSLLAEHAPEVATLPERERATCETLLARRNRQLPEAPPGRLPPLLTSPPWKSQRVKTALSVLEGLAIPDYPIALHWKSGKPRGYSHQPPPPRGADVRQAAQLEAMVKSGAGLDLWRLDSVSDETALRIWNGSPPDTFKGGWDLDRGALDLLARFGVEALPRLWELAETEFAKLFSALEVVEAPRTAPFMARALGTQKFQKAGRAWLAAYPRAAALGLIPVAVGRPGKSREEASAGLRWLASSGKDDIIMEAALEYGAEAAVREVLSFDPLQLYPDKMPKLGEFLRLESLSRPALRDGQYSLSHDGLATLCQMLAFSTLEAPYPGLEVVRELCTAESLEETAWEIFAAWLASGAPAKEKWAFFALGHFGGDESARRLVPMIRAWPQESGFARAEMGLDVLCAIGTDMALMHLNGMAQKLKSKALQARAQQRLDEVAARRGLSVEELSDRLVPDLDLEPDGTRTLDFGPRQFRVSFDELLRPIVIGSEGKPIKDLPKPSAKDDAGLAAAAVTAYKALKKDAKAIASIQIERLEQAMSKGRSWTWKDFELLLLRHPLMVHPVRRLLWQQIDEQGEGLATFRVAEDGTLADSHDDLFEPSPQSGVRIPHPLHLTDSQRKAWSDLFADYNILQPFPQLGRACYLPPDPEATSVSKVAGLVVHAGKILSLSERGWAKGEVWDGGVMGQVEKPLGQGLKAVLPFEPGIYAGGISELGDQTLGLLTVVGAEERPVSMGSLNAIAYSELIYDLEKLGGGTRGKA